MSTIPPSRHNLLEKVLLENKRHSWHKVAKKTAEQAFTMPVHSTTKKKQEKHSNNVASKKRNA